ncbi:MAG: rhodanese-like domain-containing protein [Saprospiraceae bacterium]|nr:rhodanese-like domain-containing protein [Bacteroidia bacterium]MBT8229342.1 rhodanese-like domain-containing protein [Bacteroidia bacterium]NNF21332.1 rhodanese-like domain-containing protein [Saprospiraceae bacterium]NNK89304.1 rhodanese-like domain-containing protein [Saprospiraceae bacterium]
MKTKSVIELKAMIDTGQSFQLIDVREPYEHEFSNIQGELIPLNTLTGNFERIDKDKPVIIYCRSGARSGQAVMFLEAQLGLDNLYNLDGGILAWSDEIDPKIPKY